MRISAGIQTIIDQAAKEKRCFYGSAHSQWRAMLNLARDGELKRTYCNTYMTANQWDELVPPDRVLYTARSLGERHERRVFAGHIAVAAHKLDHPWRIHDNTVVIAASCSPHSTAIEHAAANLCTACDFVHEIRHYGHNDRAYAD